MIITQQDIRLDLSSAGSFNRYTLGYTATVPLRCTLTYAEQGHERTEEFFLEVGEARIPTKRPSPHEMRAFFCCMAWRAILSPLSKLHRRLDSF